MGIPKFFRWLTRRYPMILQNVLREEDVPEVDNFYMDLNGIVHNCIHGNDPKRHERISKLNDLEEVWAAVMTAIDQLVHTIKPKKVLLLAVDGVAPRAKMNQQRARRFRSAKDAQILKEQLQAQGKNIPDLFDSNAISPGTSFMMELCNQLHFFIKYKISTDPLYQHLEAVVVSDGSVPGEGEHKMLDYIRQLRTKPTYDPNTRHCFYGADADLIMLSLLTHEPHFTIIREEHVVKKQKNGGVQRLELTKTANFQIIYVNLLREYMMLEYKPLAQKMKMKFDLERIIDDFIFFCFFIGNDFLPSLSALDIAEGSLDKLIDFYQNCLPAMTNYITENGTIHWDRAEPFIWLLAEHENEVFKSRIDQIEDRRRAPRTVSITHEASQMMGDQAGNSRALVVHNVFKEQIFNKKVQKVQKLTSKGETKKYKRYLVGKLFREDEFKMTNPRKKELQNTFAKYKLRKNIVDEEAKDDKPFPKKVLPLELWQMLDEADLSDLKPEEIPDDCISDIDQLMGETLEGNGQSNMDSLTQAQAKLTEDAEANNLKFMTDFVKIYAQDSKAAKQFYYKTKVDFDTFTPEGVAAKKKMLKKYLEGTQWVLFYYYKGAQHWRWYYPYHYAPMISDLGMNIVQDFLGTTTISEFEIDFNCPENSRPYTPFQQLLCIMPLKSFHLLPAKYSTIATGYLNKFFPSDFEVDLNGKTLAWEAIVLIPFCDEALFLQEEKVLFDQGLNLSEADTIRNISAFEIYAYNYNPNAEFKVLKPALKSFTSKITDFTAVTLIKEYENVGSMCFKSALMPGVKKPMPGYPSFEWLGVQELEPDHKVVQKVSFVRHMVKVPQCLEETQPEKLEEFIDKLCNATKKDIFVNYPFQSEAFAMYFEDKFTIYTLYGDVNTNTYTVTKSDQFRSADEWSGLVGRTLINLMEVGIYCPKSKVNVLVTCNRVQGVEFDYNSGVFYKTYQEKPDIIPLSMLMKRRDSSHPMSMIDTRVSSNSYQEIIKGAEVICLNTEHFGVVGKVERIESRKQIVVISIDKQKEESKTHDPFMGQKHIKELQLIAQGDEELQKAKTFFGDQDIEMMLKLKGGIISRITSSFLIQYKNPESGDKMVVDLGMNIKNFSKKVHVPQYVRFVSNGENAAMNQHDGYNHNKFARGANHIRSHWEYSADCVNFIKEYYEKFPQVFDAVKKCGYNKSGPAVNKLKDVFGDESPASVQKLKQVLVWIESLPISHLPYVDMGFDALDPRMIQSLEQHRQTVKETYSNITLKLKQQEFMKPHAIFSERFPYWSSPFAASYSRDFKVGHRVMNMNSQLREYIPFGLRGTVIGRTEDKVIVLFDDQFIGGTDIHYHCEAYRGAFVNPNYLLNLTKKFESVLRKNDNPQKIISMFTESNSQTPTPEETKAPTKVKKQVSEKNVDEEPAAKNRTVIYRQKSTKQEESEVIPQISFASIPANLSNLNSQLAKPEEEEKKTNFNSDASPFQPI